MNTMNYIKKRADKFVKNYIAGQLSDHEKIIYEVQSESYKIDDDLDKITFIRVILEENAREYAKHLLKCTNKDNCSVNYGHETIQYFLTQELNKLGIKTNNDQFTIEEKIIAESKLDKVLEDLQELKIGHELIYDDLKAEIQHLKELFILGKKTWHQLLLGKTTEMVIGGVISETISKEILEKVSGDFQKILLEHSSPT